ncbi:MAG TPA: holo-ACP synthase [Rhodocyclaceae bacterium]|nr:holo-ACP synthase [Rhodocyclaceae bacterium]
MIYGIGTDIVVIERMRDMYEHHGERALGRLLAPAEQETCRTAADPARYLAKRFAAKEALGKALGTGIRPPALLSAMAVLNDELGRPYFQFSGELATLIEERRLRAHLTISDEREHAVAFVVLECLS